MRQSLLSLACGQRVSMEVLECRGLPWHSAQRASWSISCLGRSPHSASRRGAISAAKRGVSRQPHGAQPEANGSTQLYEHNIELPNPLPACRLACYGRADPNNSDALLTRFAAFLTPSSIGSLLRRALYCVVRLGRTKHANWRVGIGVALEPVRHSTT